ncbi:hypothetical protein [Agrobacterium tumefaciens]|uniref:hypothetical protein n=1 Tax=Agrobacterium tumefaciens TaxID=358 RepID=UPI00287D55A4|nr:hypothetical protein [Agrobacterium tumefaciens]MDS7596575.1 hypothetical protein [Agrobacterium tumefaciens]
MLENLFRPSPTPSSTTKPDTTSGNQSASTQGGSASSNTTTSQQTAQTTGNSATPAENGSDDHTIDDGTYSPTPSQQPETNAPEPPTETESAGESDPAPDLPRSVGGDDTEATQPAAASPSQPSSSTTTPAEANISAQTSAARPDRQVEKPTNADAIEARASLRRSLAENEAALEGARNQAIEAQKDRIVRGLLDSAIIGAGPEESVDLLAPRKVENGRSGLVNRYYAEA